MSKMKKIALFLLILAFGGTLPGQQPSAPLVMCPASPMAWKMTCAKGSAASGLSSRAETAAPNSKQLQPVLLEYILSGELMKITVNFEDGSHREYWKVKNAFLCRVGKSTIIRAFSDDLPRYPCASLGFYGVENVKPEHAKGIANLGGVPCQYFQGKRPATSLEHPILAGETDPVPEIQYEAWFDLRSGLPKAYRAEGKTWIYEFLPSPTSPLTLPPEWQAALDKYRLDLRRAGLDR